jgi:hypothetical protein
MKVTWDPGDESVLVSELSNGGWLLFTRASLAVNRAEAVADQIRYDVVVTGGLPLKWDEHDRSFELARAAFADPSQIELAMHAPSWRITVAVARYLAMKDRIDAWGGWTGEADHLPRLYDALSPADRAMVAARLRDEAIVVPCATLRDGLARLPERRPSGEVKKVIVGRPRGNSR